MIPPLRNRSSPTLVCLFKKTTVLCQSPGPCVVVGPGEVGAPVVVESAVVDSVVTVVCGAGADVTGGAGDDVIGGNGTSGPGPEPPPHAPLPALASAIGYSVNIISFTTVE